jgi:hypothetical protein
MRAFNSNTPRRVATKHESTLSQYEPSIDRKRKTNDRSRDSLHQRVTELNEVAGTEL